MPTLGHVVFYVRNLSASTAFYQDVVGLALAGRIFNGRGALLTGGQTHHELLLIEVGDAPGPLHGRRVGLYHVGWKLGDDIETLRRTYARLQTMGYPIDGLTDHAVSKSIYLKDPDGNEIELFIDDPSVDWKTSDAWMDEPVKPLHL